MAKKVATAETRTYFLTYLLPATLTEAEVTALRDEVSGLVSKHKGKIVKTDEWGKRSLSYKLKHAGNWQTEAVYTHLTLTLSPDQVQPLEKDLYLQTNILRHLLVRIEDKEIEAVQ